MTGAPVSHKHALKTVEYKMVSGFGFGHSCFALPVRLFLGLEHSAVLRCAFNSCHRSKVRTHHRLSCCKLRPVA